MRPFLARHGWHVAILALGCVVMGALLGHLLAERVVGERAATTPDATNTPPTEREAIPPPQPERFAQPVPTTTAPSPETLSPR